MLFALVVSLALLVSPVLLGAAPPAVSLDRVAHGPADTLPRASTGTPGSCATGITGTVRDASASVPLPGAEVRVRWTTGDGSVAEGSIQADASGRYSLCSLDAPIRLWLVGTAYDREGRPVAVTVSPGDSLEQDLAVPLQRGESGAVAGRILDQESKRPVEAATVTIPGIDASALTDPYGRFGMEGVPPGTHTLELHHVAYGDHSVEVQVPEGVTVDVEIEAVQEAVEVDPISVTVEAREPYLDQSGYYEREDWAEVRGGHFVTPEFLERRNPLRVSHVMEDIPRVKTSRHGIPFVSGSLGISSGCNEGMLVYLDRMKFPLQPPQGIDAIPVSDVAAMEVYRDPSELPAEFSGSDSRCGVVVIWTKRGT